MTAVDTSEPPFMPRVAVPLIIELAGDPKGKGRPRFSRKGGFAYTPTPTRNYEAALRYAAQMKMANTPPIEGPVKLVVDAFFSVPASWSHKKRAAALSGLVRPTGRPDCDNLLKTMDALNAVVWRDDAQVVIAVIAKRYSDRPRLRIEVEKMIGEAG